MSPSNNDVSHLLERLEAFEDRLNARLEGLSAQALDSGKDNYYLRVNGELHSTGGTELNQNIQIVATLYEPSGRILDTKTYDVRSDAFFGFRAFQFYFQVDRNARPAKVRVYPQAR